VTDFVFDFSKKSQEINIDTFNECMDDDGTGWILVKTDFAYTTRWHNYRNMVFHNTATDTYWNFLVGFAATENQDDAEFVSVTQVQPVQRMTTFYEPI
jgi:hypothetical protein